MALSSVTPIPSEQPWTRVLCPAGVEEIKGRAGRWLDLSTQTLNKYHNRAGFQATSVKQVAQDTGQKQPQPQQ